MLRSDHRGGWWCYVRRDSLTLTPSFGLLSFFESSKSDLVNNNDIVFLFSLGSD